MYMYIIHYTLYKLQLWRKAEPKYVCITAGPVGTLLVSKGERASAAAIQGGFSLFTQLIRKEKEPPLLTIEVSTNHCSFTLFTELQNVRDMMDIFVKNKQIPVCRLFTQLM